MSDVIAAAKNIVFAIVCVAPLLGLVIGGAVLPYGQKAHVPFPRTGAIFEGKPGALDALGKALLDRSPVTEAAIRIKHWAGYGGIEFVDTAGIISGRDGWLFTKSDFDCPGAAAIDRAATAARTMIDLAAAADIELYISVSPDKSSIYPEELLPAARRYWSCKPASAAAMRGALDRGRGRLIDHAVPILQAKARDPRAKLYFHTDTHWTPLGAAFALRQLIAAIAGTGMPALPAPRITGKAARRTDMGNEMLLLSGDEEFDAIDSAIEEGLADQAHLRGRSTVLLHDSFYLSLRPILAANFIDGAFFSIQDETDAPSPALRAALASAGRIVANSVERGFAGRVNDGVLGWNGPLGTAVVARNAAAAAAGCRWDGADEMAAGQTSAAVELTADGRDALPCLRVELAPAGVLVIGYGAKSGAGGAGARQPFEIRVRASETPVMLILPAAARGSPVTVELAGSVPTAALRRVSVGSVSPHSPQDAR
jgi:hypothetical protein